MVQKVTSIKIIQNYFIQILLLLTFTSFALSFAILSLYISLYIISFCTMRTRDVLKYIDIQQKLWTSVNLKLIRALWLNSCSHCSHSSLARWPSGVHTAFFSSLSLSSCLPEALGPGSLCICSVWGCELTEFSSWMFFTMFSLFLAVTFPETIITIHANLFKILCFWLDLSPSFISPMTWVAG